MGVMPPWQTLGSVGWLALCRSAQRCLQAGQPRGAISVQPHRSCTWDPPRGASALAGEEEEGGGRSRTARAEMPQGLCSGGAPHSAGVQGTQKHPWPLWAVNWSSKSFSPARGRSWWPLCCSLRRAPRLLSLLGTKHLHAEALPPAPAQMCDQQRQTHKRPDSTPRSPVLAQLP